MEASRISAPKRSLYDRRAAKKPAQLRINGDLLKKAHELGINPSATLEDALADEISKRNREIWLEENREAIETYNELVAKHGVFSDGVRGF
ncbi:MAG TPA: type II toxin-antitoxin system CcdA family antitoxin [Thermoanaerobaculia bacterium]|nr:type II toxin-antitoxin system CcdA family antitoxin [Thermoanaerobaculia bacterium]